MPAKACLNHKDAPAVAQCHQCHKPICKACVQQVPEGSFCSTPCLTKYRDFKARWKDEGKKESSVMSKVVGLVLLAAVLMGALYVAHHWLGVDAVAQFDILGKILNK